MRTESYSDHPLEPLADGWYPVTLSRDLPAGMPMPVVLAGREIVVWRGEGGAVRAWVDRCPHRGMRLSLGFVRGDTLSCLYHGWRYRGADAGCELIPAHPDLDPPKTIAAEPYAAAEAGGVVFVRAGETGDEPVPDAPPDGPAGFVGSVSVTVDVSAAILAAAAAGLGEGIRALVQPVLSGRARLHVTARPDRLRAAVVLAEGLRHRLETAPAVAAE
ncbi:Rieske 2Fe-2S domain-containing protein [Oharaeibacter diazotrophicus]|uniref:Rieske-like 2Fe-2S protein n=1 Tax=Oharaeibacter diazotrophicus TaxID=1920512 RepID=A0A4R6REL3_9HYPH|nr:Rieske 2Fe-2S domain-containing protein [Oharaeibacter diazotrophicus]TDP84197.1 Rieske-like 2Fe-2S protein [Oharaeibacter diazotrophicus]BBE73235.1 Rieske (2Fe-2S) protein [Pleomorphomonas sp. SM30]